MPQQQGQVLVITNQLALLLRSDGFGFVTQTGLTRDSQPSSDILSDSDVVKQEHNSLSQRTETNEERPKARL
jgi:hypothetical protein